MLSIRIWYYPPPRLDSAVLEDEHNVNTESQDPRREPDKTH
jgi:hypothetical protein